MPLPSYADADALFYPEVRPTASYTPAQPAIAARTRAYLAIHWAHLTLSLLPLLVAFAYLGATAENTYGPSHLFLTYSHGFLKRALIGTLFSPLGFLSTRTLFHIQLGAFALLAVTVFLLFRRILFGAFPERCFAAFLLAGPAMLPHFAYMSGELDTYLFLAALLALGALLSLPGKLGLGVATTAAVTGLLIHEAFALMFYPLLLAAGLELVRKRRVSPRALAAHFTMVLLAFAVIVHFGKLHSPMRTAMTAAQQRTDLQLEPTVFLVLGSTLRDQLIFVRHLYTPRLIAGVLLAVIASIPYFAVLWRLLSKAMRQGGRSDLQTRCLLLLLAGSPLLLCVLGHDAMRWISASAINLSLYLLYLYSSEPEHSPVRAALTSWTATPAFAAAFAYSLALGPYGIASNRLIANVGVILSHLH